MCQNNFRQRLLYHWRHNLSFVIQSRPLVFEGGYPFSDKPTKCPQVESGSVYYITNFGERYLDIYNAYTTDNTRALTYDFTGALNQQFKIVNVTGAEYEIIPQHAPGKVLSVNSSKQVVIDTDCNLSSQRWYIYYYDGRYHFVNKRYNSDIMGTTYDSNYVSVAKNYDNCCWGLERVFYNKPYDPNYPYTINGVPNKLTSESYYRLLDGYSYTLRNDAVYQLTYDEIDIFGAYLVKMTRKSATELEHEQVIQDIKTVLGEGFSYIINSVPVLKPVVPVLDGISTTSAVKNLNSSSIQSELDEILKCTIDFSHQDISGTNNAPPKPDSVTYKISLLKQNPHMGRQVKIESSDGEKEIYTIQNGTYEIVQLAIAACAHNLKIYKIAPDWSYIWE